MMRHGLGLRSGRPFSRCRQWSAAAAAFGSWVTMTTVLPWSRTSIRKKIEDLFRRLAVEVAGGLVGDQQPGVGDDGAGDGDALFLAPGELGRAVVRAVGETDEVEGAGARARGVRRGFARTAAAAVRRSRRPRGSAPGDRAGRCSRRGRARQRVRAARRRSWRCRTPPMFRSPAVGLSMPAMRLSSVVLPLPEGPINARKVPSSTSRSRSLEGRHRGVALLVALGQPAAVDKRSVRHGN